MMCNDDDLLALSRDELPAERAAEVEDHATSCATCAGELAWLRAEAGLFARRAEAAKAVKPPPFAAIADRITVERERAEAKKKRRKLWTFAGAGAGVAAAAVALLVLIPRGQPAATKPASEEIVEVKDDDPKETDQVVVAVERAEKEYARAIDALEGAYDEQRAELPPEVAKMRDAEVRRLRRELDEIRGLAGDDMDGRLRALQATAAYVRSMQTIVLQEDQP
jgi:hypothetical protein